MVVPVVVVEEGKLSSEVNGGLAGKDDDVFDVFGLQPIRRIDDKTIAAKVIINRFHKINLYNGNTFEN